MLDKLKRLRESFAKEKDPDIVLNAKAIYVGMSNFYFKSKKESEAAMLKYQKFCLNCKHNVIDPVESMRVEDSQCPELSGKMCDLCGCVLSYKLRQTIKPCQKWK